MTPAQQFEIAAARKAADLQHRAVILKNIGTYDHSVARGKSKFSDWQNARSLAAQIKFETINHLDRYLEQFERKVIENGGQVFWAETAEDARRLVGLLGGQIAVESAVGRGSIFRVTLPRGG